MVGRFFEKLKDDKKRYFIFINKEYESIKDLNYDNLDEIIA